MEIKCASMARVLPKTDVAYSAVRDLSANNGALLSAPFTVVRVEDLC